MSSFARVRMTSMCLCPAFLVGRISVSSEAASEVMRAQCRSDLAHLSSRNDVKDSQPMSCDSTVAECSRLRGRIPVCGASCRPQRPDSTSGPSDAALCQTYGSVVFERQTRMDQKENSFASKSLSGERRRLRVSDARAQTTVRIRAGGP